MSKTFALYVGVAIATLIGHYALNNQRQMASLEVLVKAGDQKDRIQTDQIRELIYNLQQASQKNETSRNEGFIAGVIDAMQKPDHYMAIWHNGYDRGSEVQKEVINASYALKPEPDPQMVVPAREKK
jgi:hypothetical protein